MNSDASIDRFLIAMGGFLGFAGAFLASLKTDGEDIAGALLRASIAMLAGALVMKLFVFMLHSIFRQAVADRRSAAKKNREETDAPAEGAASENLKHKAG